jgi:hypothetical protein
LFYEFLFALYGRVIELSSDEEDQQEGEQQDGEQQGDDEQQEEDDDEEEEAEDDAGSLQDFIVDNEAVEYESEDSASGEFDGYVNFQ